MIALFLTITGLLMLFYSIFLCLASAKLISKIVKSNRYSYILFSIFLFICGYLVFIWYLLAKISNVSFMDIVVSLVFFFGAVFVVFVFEINKKLLNQISRHADGLNESNKNLEELNKKLTESTRKLKESEQKYKDKNNELEEALEGVYMLRMRLAEISGSEDMKIENESIKKKIDELKKET